MARFPFARNTWIGALVVCCAAISLLAMGGCAYFKDWKQIPSDKQNELTIYVVGHGWHTGIALARDNLGDELAFIPKELGESAFYEFGWGEKDFYQAPENTVGLALQALFWKNESTMQVVAVPSNPNDYFENSTIVELRVSTEGHRNLAAAVASSFARDENGESRSTRDGLYGHSRFFEARGTFYFANTCNTWTARTLAAAGVPVTTVLTLTAGSVIRQAKRAADKYACCSSTATKQ
jgi:uncharacterized protein (TIGR02117 family)